MQVDCRICETTLPAKYAAHLELRGKTCYFCCEACRRSFYEHPDLFPDARLARASGEAAAGRQAA